MFSYKIIRVAYVTPCSLVDIYQRGEGGGLRHPSNPTVHYRNYKNCRWTRRGPDGDDYYNAVSWDMTTCSEVQVYRLIYPHNADEVLTRTHSVTSEETAIFLP